MTPLGSAAALSWRLWRAGGRRGLVTSLLAVTASAVATALPVLTVGVWTGFEARADRTRWRAPEAATAAAEATAVQRVTTSSCAGRELVVIDLAATGAGAPGSRRARTASPPPARCSSPRRRPQRSLSDLQPSSVTASGPSRASWDERRSPTPRSSWRSSGTRSTTPR